MEAPAPCYLRELLWFNGDWEETRLSLWRTMLSDSWESAGKTCLKGKLSDSCKGWEGSAISFLKFSYQARSASLAFISGSLLYFFQYIKDIADKTWFKINLLHFQISCNIWNLTAWLVYLGLFLLQRLIDTIISDRFHITLLKSWLRWTQIITGISATGCEIGLAEEVHSFCLGIPCWEMMCANYLRTL